MDLISSLQDAIKKQSEKIGTKADLPDAIPYEFSSLESSTSKIAFVDGGEALLLDSADFSLHFIRVYAGVWQGTTFVLGEKKEYYILLTSNDVECFGDLELPAFDCSKEELIGMIRRYAELKLADSFDCKVVLDGNLQTHEDILKPLLSGKSALSKTNDVLSDAKSSVAVDLLKLAKERTWKAKIAPHMYFAKFHPQSRYVFKIETSDESIIDELTCHCKDPSFLGYPYGLLHADKNARVGNEERNYLRTKLLLSLGNSITQHLNTKNAHDILDTQ